MEFDRKKNRVRIRGRSNDSVSIGPLSFPLKEPYSSTAQVRLDRIVCVRVAAEWAVRGWYIGYEGPTVDWW